MRWAQSKVHYDKKLNKLFFWWEERAGASLRSSHGKLWLLPSKIRVMLIRSLRPELVMFLALKFFSLPLLRFNLVNMRRFSQFVYWPDSSYRRSTSLKHTISIVIPFHIVGIFTTFSVREQNRHFLC